jgi:putative endonuclease
MNTKDIGNIGEKKAVRFLKKNGYRIIAKNKHESHNEIDIIASDPKFIVFVEVKTRTVNSNEDVSFGYAASAVNLGKQERTIKGARSFISSNPKKAKNKMIRFDVIEIYLDKNDLKVKGLNHIENAFVSK